MTINSTFSDILLLYLTYPNIFFISDSWPIVLILSLGGGLVSLIVIGSICYYMKTKKKKKSYAFGINKKNTRYFTVKLFCLLLMKNSVVVKHSKVVSVILDWQSSNCKKKRTAFSSNGSLTLNRFCITFREWLHQETTLKKKSNIFDLE